MFIIYYKNNYLTTVKENNFLDRVYISIENDIKRRKIMKKLIIAVMSLLLVCSIAFANGAEESTSSGPVTVTFWNGYTGSDRPVLEDLVNQFNESQDEVYIDMLIMPWDTLYQRLMTSFIAGDGPDLIGFNIDRFAEYASAGRLLDLTSYIESSDVISADVMAPALYNAGKYNGVQYAVPMSSTAVAMYYNKDHFRAAGLDPDNPPQTLEELFDAWDKLIVKDENGNVTQYAQAIGVRSTVAMIPAFMWLYGADYIDENGDVVINSPEAVECMTMLQEAFAKGVSPVGLTGQEADNLFSAGVASIEWNGPWAYNGFVDAGIDVGVCELPSGVEGRKATIGGDSVLVINKDSKVADAAWAFIEYWNSPDTQRQWSSGTGAPPTRMDMSDDEELLSANPNIAVFLAASENARIFMAGQTLASRFDTEALVPLYESIARGMETPEEALATAEATMNSILGK